MAGTILIVDDSTVTRKVIKKHLSKGPYANLKVLEAPDGQKAMEFVEEGSIDLILSDWNMPKMNGLEFVTRVRAYEQENKRPEDQRAKIVMVTTEGTIDKVTQAMEAGVNQYIVKPFTAETLTKTLKKVLTVRV